MPTTAPLTLWAIIALAGLALVAIGILGGGVKIISIEIPKLEPRARWLAGIVGGAFLVLGASAAYKVEILPTPGPIVDGKKEDPFLGAAIKNRLITVTEVKLVLRQLGHYPESEELDERPHKLYFQAVASFQRSNGIDQDGLVGPITFSKLRDALPTFFERPNRMRPIPAVNN